MKFERYLKLSSTLLILTGFYAILITGSYTSSVFVGIATTVLYWMLGERLTEMLPVPKWFWNIVALTLLGYLGYDSFFQSLDLIGNGIKFVVYLQVVKLLSPKTNRDQMQIYLLSFLHILASTVISNDISFSIPFLIYVVLATWTLVMFNLKLQLESSVSSEKREAAVAWLLQSNNIITRNFLGLTSLLSLTIIAFTLLVFFSFPRVSMGNFLKRIDIHRNVSGFSSEVALGSIGNIKLNNAVALRVEFDKDLFNNIDVERLYWRGTASDYFDGRKWKQTYETKSPVRMELDNPILQVGRKKMWSGKIISYHVFLEGMNPPILFGADSLIRITWDKPMIERIFRGSIGLAEDSYSGLYFSGTNLFAADLTYNGESILEDPPLYVLQNDEKSVPSYLVSDFLQLPSLNPDVKKLILSIPLPDASPYEKAQAIVRYLEKNYKYTLDVQDTGVEDPLRFFLVDRKRGHCEYFSTALAVALRVHGIPSRNVVGFRGGEINPYGKYLAVRQSDAHSWVEAYFPSIGWARLDPSPLDSTVRSREATFKAFNQFYDYLRLRWNKYIIEYDLRSQAQIVENIGKRLSEWTRGKNSSSKNKENTDSSDASRPRSFPKLFGLLIGLLILCVGLWKILKKKQRHFRRGYGNFLCVIRLLRKYGFEKKSSETAFEFMKRVEITMGTIPSLLKLTNMYYEERFGKRKIPKQTWDQESEALTKELGIRERSRQHAA